MKTQVSKGKQQLFDFSDIKTEKEKKAETLNINQSYLPIVWREGEKPSSQLK